MSLQCRACQTVLAAGTKFCTQCGSKDLIAPTAAATSSNSFTAATPAAAPLPTNSNKIAMDEHEFKDFLGSISRGLMQDKDQITKIKAAASAHYFTCAQAIVTAAHVKGHPGEAIITLYPALVDADVTNFSLVLGSLKWIEERQEVVQALKLDEKLYASVLKK